MADVHTADELLDFLAHAAERGLMPAATAQALSVATRNVISVLSDEERADLPLDDLDGVVRRFTNKRARDYNPDSLKEYGRRLRRAVDLYLQWKADPANFAVKTRATTPARARERKALAQPVPADNGAAELGVTPAIGASGYQTAFPVRPGHVVSLSNIPHDLSQAEAERLAQFIRLLSPA